LEQNRACRAGAGRRHASGRSQRLRRIKPTAGLAATFDAPVGA
jgi:hypothetical protein